MKIFCSKKSYVVLLTIGFLLLFTAIYVVAPLICESAEIQSNEVVKLETRPGVTQKFILIKPENPVASVILFAGGRGNLILGSTLGSPSISNLSKNFLVRTRKDFARQDLMVAVIDAPSDNPRMNAVWRMSEEHGQDIKSVINYLKDQAKIPVWLVGTSAGTYSAPNGVIRNQEVVDGLVLTSSCTRCRKRGRICSTHPNGIINMELMKITVPVFIVSHKWDKCKLTLPSNAPKLKAAFVNSPKVEVMYFTGGKIPESEQCHHLSPHGFYGIEDEVVTAIADFIKANSTSVGQAPAPSGFKVQ